MNTDSSPTGDAPARHSLGGRAIAAVPGPVPLRPAGDRPAPERADAAGSPGAWFAVVLRGYDRTQVDAHLTDLDRRIRDATARADAAEAALAAARTHARGPRQPVGTGSDDGGFGRRVERVLQAAEREADELRERASAEAADLVEKARADAERARRKTEEALLGRAAKLDAEFTTRSAALDAREREVDRIVDDARREADDLRAEARRSAAAESASAERRAADLLTQAERTIEQQRADATRDIGRMTALRDEVRRELARLHGLLRGEFDEEPVSTRLAVAPDPAPADVETSSVDDDVRDDDRSGDSRDAEDTADDEDPADNEDNVRTTIGTIPPYTASSVGVLPFGDRSAGGPANGRSFAFGLVPGMRSDPATDDADSDESDTSRTSTDVNGRGSASDRNPTRSTLPRQGRR